MLGFVLDGGWGTVGIGENEVLIYLTAARLWKTIERDIAGRQHCGMWLRTLIDCRYYI